VVGLCSKHESGEKPILLHHGFGFAILLLCIYGADMMRINATVVIERLTGWITDRFSDTGKSRAVLGLSGGLDSSVTTALCVRALGADNVLGVMMPYRTSDPSSKADAETVAELLGVTARQVPITAMADAYLEPAGVSDRVRVGNVCARCRMIVLYDLSTESDALVVGTGNRTEHWLGYTTLWGDNAAAMSPLSGLWKTQVREVAVALGVSERILQKRPSADLWRGQTDEEELGMSYADADAVLHRMFDLRKSDEQIRASGDVDPSVVDRVRACIEHTGFKRRLPPGPDPEWLCR
jgi:NAD+ synthase